MDRRTHLFRATSTRRVRSFSAGVMLSQFAIRDSVCRRYIEFGLQEKRKHDSTYTITVDHDGPELVKLERLSAVHGDPLYIVLGWG